MAPSVNSCLGRPDTDVDVQLQKLQQVDVEIVEAREHLRSCLERRNCLIPCARLPTELLQRIFAIHSRGLASEHMDSIGLAYSQTCRHWRYVALSTPSIWTCIPVKQIRLAQEMISRSRGTPLTVISTIQNGTIPRLLEDLLTTSRPICDLTIDGIQPWSFRIVRAGEITHARNLRHLRLRRADFSYGRHINVAAFQLQEFLRVVGPGLKSLCLSGYRLDSVPCNFPSLELLDFAGPHDVEVELEDSDEEEFIMWHTDTLISLLLATPKLKALRLHRVCEDTFGEERSSAKTPKHIHLPNLKTISLRGSNLRGINRILALIQVSSDIRFHLRNDVLDLSEDGLCMTVTRISQLLPIAWTQSIYIRAFDSIFDLSGSTNTLDKVDFDALSLV